MNCKLALFFLVAVCLAQGFQARSAEPKGILDDAIQKIKEIIKKIEDAIGQISGQIPDIIKNLEDKIKQFIEQLNIDEVIQNIKAKIQEKLDEILAQAGVDPDAVKECVNSAKDAEQQLVDDAKQGVVKCQQAAEDEVAELSKQVGELTNEAQNLLEHGQSVVQKCIQENGADIIGAVKCLKNELVNLKTEAEALVEKVQATIALAKEKVNQIQNELTSCAAEVKNQIVEKQQAIIEDFKTCVEAHSQKPEQ